MAVAHDCQEVLFLIKDNDRLSAEHVAEVSSLICCSHAEITLNTGSMPKEHPRLLLHKTSETCCPRRERHNALPCVWSTADASAAAAELLYPVQVRVKAEDLVRNDCIHGWHTLRNIKGKEMKGGGELKLKIQLIKIPDNPVYARGINAADPNSAAVEDAFFQEHEGNQVVMYQVSCLVRPTNHVLGELPYIITTTVPAWLFGVHHFYLV